MKKERVAVLVPLSNARQFTASERISLAHIDRYLSRYPRYFIVPPGNALQHPGFEEAIFAEKYFGSAIAHSRLLLSQEFYSAFSEYEFVLIHHLDSLVFSDDLENWCERGFDLIAPPWLPGPDVPWLREPGVGNGGLSLRRVERFLAVLASRRPWYEPGTPRLGDGVAAVLRTYARRWRYGNDVNGEIAYHLQKGHNEDRFWWKSGRKYLPELNIAPVETALEFGFEANPRDCLERNQGRLPFGCHAWERYDRDFWLPHLLPDVAVAKAG